MENIGREPDLVHGTLHGPGYSGDKAIGKPQRLDPFFVILNLAVGGAWPGNPDATTAFPQQMRVDYVRVYKPAR
jgi:beta-glucanase (GH16 family)